LLLITIFTRIIPAVSSEANQAHYQQQRWKQLAHQLAIHYSNGGRILHRD